MLTINLNLHSNNNKIIIKIKLKNKYKNIIDYLNKYCYNVIHNVIFYVLKRFLFFKGVKKWLTK